MIVEDGVAKLPDRSAFAGSVATANRLLRVMVNLAEVPLTDAIQMLTATPARILVMSARKGTLESGKEADIVIFDDQFDVHLTMVKGKVVYKTSSI